MLTAVTTLTANSIEVRFVDALRGTNEDTHAGVEPKDGPSPIAPEMKELAWTAGAFVLFAVLMRLVLYPRLKSGMDARYAGIRGGHEGADAARAEGLAQRLQKQEGANRHGLRSAAELEPCCES